MHFLDEKKPAYPRLLKIKVTYKVICSCIGFLFDFQVSVLPSDCTSDDTQAAAVAVNNTTNRASRQLAQFYMKHKFIIFVSPFIARSFAPLRHQTLVSYVTLWADGLNVCQSQQLQWNGKQRTD